MIDILSFIERNYGPLMTIIVAVPLGLFYFIQFGNRMHAVERKLGIIHNGKLLEEVVTKGDLLEFGATLVKDISREFVKADVCLLKHGMTIDKLKELETFLRK